MTKKSGDRVARGILEMVKGEVEKKPRKPVGKWSLSPIKGDLRPRGRSDLEDKPSPVDMKQCMKERRQYGDGSGW
jgi:hypothetical protein